jgi:glycosyltransferase involved in cell wall biosynthesis
VASSLRVDRYVANSRLVASRIAKTYRREAAVVHPPIDAARFATQRAPGEHYLVVSRLVPYKRVELAIAACRAANRKLRVVGDGPLYKQLKAQAGPDVEFLGHLTDHEVAGQYAESRALLFPGFEDFGLTPLEAMASSRPVVAYGRGGALETVVDGVTGVLFGEQTAESLGAALARLEASDFAPAALARHAAGYDEAVFAASMRALIDETWQAHQDRRAAPELAAW